MVRPLSNLILLVTLCAVAAANATASFDCARVAGGPGKNAISALALSNAHAQIRFFGAHSKYSMVDQALAQTLRRQSPLGQVDLSLYREALVDVCTTPSETRALGSASITMIESTAIIKPGKEASIIPTAANAVILDLRDLPNGAETELALKNLLAQILSGSLALPDRRVRAHRGLTDEGFAANNYYANRLSIIQQPAIQGQSRRFFPLAVLLSGRIAPKVAEIAAALRLSGKAWLIGEDIPVAVAELQWVPLGESGLSFRFSDLFSNTQRWPDVVRADFGLKDVYTVAKDLPSLKAPHPREEDVHEGVRSAIQKIEPFGDLQAPNDSVGDLRASLIIAHGALKQFFADFKDHGTEMLDQRLLEVLADVQNGQSINRPNFRNFLRRLGNSIHDGHNFVFDRTSLPAGAGACPILFDQINGRPIVAASLVENIVAGDELLAVDGEDVKDWLKQELGRAAGATSGYQFDLAMRELQIMVHDRTFKMRSPSGEVKNVVVKPQPFQVFSNLHRADHSRKSGWLSDLGASRTYYINLAGFMLNDLETFKALLREAQGGSGLVLDMRDYPGVSGPEMARRLIPYFFKAPQYRTLGYDGPGRPFVYTEPQFPLPPANDVVYTGPIVLLLGPGSVSAAEDFSTMLVDAKRVWVVGRQSAGTNGNMTGVQLPGSFVFTFTGMQVRHVDGSPYMGTGILPDKLVTLRCEDLLLGYDRTLVEALNFFK